MTALPGGQPMRQFLKPAERSGGLGQLPLVQRRRRARLEVGAGQMTEQRPDFVQIRRHVRHRILPFCVSLHLAAKLVMVAAMAKRAGIFGQFLLATAVLTRLPVAPRDANMLEGAAAGEGAVAMASWAFPAVGAGIGMIAALVMFVAASFGLGEAPAALLALVAAGLVTGALHEDGLADTADGFGGGRTRDEKLAIMRDSRQGTYGIIALILSIGLRAVALASIPGPIEAG